MSKSAARPIARYALVSSLVLLAGIAGLSLVVAAGAMPAVLLAAGLALAVQVAAFSLIVMLRHTPRGFLLAWGAGMLLRFAVVIGGGLLLVRAGFPRLPLLLGLVGFVFALLLLELVFLHRGAAHR
jgi:hypothetical protein